MIRFGLRLTLAGGREALVRLVVISVAMALGVGMLLTALAGLGGVTAQADRYAWLNSANEPAAQQGPDPLWWQLRTDVVGDEVAARIDLAATGPRSPIPPGLDRLPAPGEYFASPALAERLAGSPADQLGDRYPGRLAGILGDAALPAPDALIAVVGYSPAELSQRPDVARIGTISAKPPGHCRTWCFSGVDPAGVKLILAVVAAALIFPLFILIATTTRLSATRREQRFAAMRLVGGTPRQIAVVAAAEATVSAIAGALGGFAVFFALRGTVAAIPFTGAPMFVSDLALTVPIVLGVALGVPALAVVAALLALRRVQISPLGVTRQVRPRPPRAWRIVPLVLGLAELAYFIGRRPPTTNGQVAAYLSGIFLTMIGLLVAGPWLTMAGARLVARRAGGTASLIAARRLAANPKAGFRSVSGLVIALFVTTVAVGIMGSIAAGRSPAVPDADRTMLITMIRGKQTDPVPDALPGTPGVREVAVTRQPPESMPVPPAEINDWGFPSSLAACADIARMPSNGRCAPGAEVAWTWHDMLGPAGWNGTWPTADISAAALPALRADAFITLTDGTPASVARARTVIENALPAAMPPYTDAEGRTEDARVFDGWKRLADVVVLASLAIAGCSLAVSIAGGLSERKRPFSMLRLTGVPLATLRQVVALESVAPLVAASAVALCAGLLAAHLFLRAQMNMSLQPPGLAFYAVVLTGIAASLGVISLTLPLLRQITGPEVARND
ncbi:FtsX-like permease family protein [Paractinoplanes lichenicola]|uniref:ABC transporter permease n=1 Tax=Paractinoplanes lichenicola TaxID=2802976 RepID=A0ABS1VYT3_9ACTN|nr:FtsX-like permease family protein [Actinoplanes lichenicola]MBL7259588.1 ABC transporter permease [Actinoplanes lichenicola]